MDLHQNRGGQGIEIEEFDRLGDDIVHAPPVGIVAHETLSWGRNIVGDQEGRIFTSVSPEDDLPDLPFIIFQGDEGLMDIRIGVFSFVMGDVDSFPGAQLIQVPDQFLATPWGDEPDTQRFGLLLRHSMTETSAKDHRDIRANTHDFHAHGPPAFFFGRFKQGMVFLWHDGPRRGIDPTGKRRVTLFSNIHEEAKIVNLEPRRLRDTER